MRFTERAPGWFRAFPAATGIVLLFQTPRSESRGVRRRSSVFSGVRRCSIGPRIGAIGTFAAIEIVELLVGARSGRWTAEIPAQTPGVFADVRARSAAFSPVQTV